MLIPITLDLVSSHTDACACAPATKGCHFKGLNGLQTLPITLPVIMHFFWDINFNVHTKALQYRSNRYSQGHPLRVSELMQGYKHHVARYG